MRYTPADGDDNAIFDIRAIYQQHYRDFEMFDASQLFFPRMGSLELVTYENVWAAVEGDGIFDNREVSRDGAVVVVRPDQYVAAVLPLDRPELFGEFFDGVLTPHSPVA